MTLSAADIKLIVAAIKPLIPTAAQVADAVWAKQMSATGATGAKISGTSSYFLRKSMVAATAGADVADKGIASAELESIIAAALRTVRTAP